jgi:hypothetical protein
MKLSEGATVPTASNVAEARSSVFVERLFEFIVCLFIFAPAPDTPDASHTEGIGNGDKSHPALDSNQANPGSKSHNALSRNALGRGSG